MKLRFALIATVLTCFFANPAEAKNWVVDYANSKLEFTGQEGDKSFTGHFGSFNVAVDFDPDKPEAGKINATINTASATAGSAERDGFLPQSDWFDIKKFTEATFTATNIHKTADGYVAEGSLTIKGISRPIKLNFALSPEGDHMRVKGKADLIRTDFKIGDGDWANENYVKFAVTVNVDLAAKPAP